MDTEGHFRAGSRESSFDGSKPRRIAEPTLKPLLQPERTPFSTTILFWGSVVLMHALAITGIVLLAYWCHLYGGYSWSNPVQQFWFHPLLMVLGLIFCYGDAIVVYRVLAFLPKWILKLIHASLHLSAIVLSSVGLAAVFENHRRTNLADLWSLHSWVGLATFGFFCLQYVIGFILFLVPGIPLSIRSMAMPIHTFLGVGIFIMAVATAHMGLTERLIWTENYKEGLYTEKGTIGNVLGLLLILYAFMVVLLATHSRFKRKPLPSEIAPTN